MKEPVHCETCKPCGAALMASLEREVEMLKAIAALQDALKMLDARFGAAAEVLMGVLAGSIPGDAIRKAIANAESMSAVRERVEAAWALSAAALKLKPFAVSDLMPDGGPAAASGGEERRDG